MPVTGESLRGYLLRVADSNGLAGLRLLLDQVNIDAPENELEAVAAFMGRSKNDLKRLTGVVPKADASRGGLQHALGLPIRFWNTSYPRFCPVCLEKSNIWQAQWELALVVACPIHRLRLVDQCQKCHQVIRWSRKHLMQCDCGQSLTEITAEGCTEEESGISVRQMHLLLPEVFEEPMEYDVLKSLGLNDLTCLLWFIGGYVSGISAKPLKITGVYRVEVALQLMNAAGASFTCWPKNFHSFMYEFGDFGGNSNNMTGLMKRFGFFYHSLYRNFEGEKFAFLHKTFEDFLKEYWPGAFAKRNRRLSNELIQDHRMLALPMVAKELRVTRKKIKQMIANGQLAASTYITSSGRKVISIDRESLLMLKSAQTDWVTFAEARSMLGLSKKRFRSLMDMDVMKAVSGPKIDGSAVWRFSRTIIETILSKPEAITIK
ncbi:MAG: TniQ family protein [Pseudomonadota bacterium]